ncbi:MAG: putative membrane protein [Arenicella sp.]|jgi:uncharacterized membrane protein
MNKSVKVKIGWFLVSTLILVLVTFAIKRAIDTYTGMAHEDLFELRYLEHPVVTALHMLSGILFIALAPLQMIKKVRIKRLSLHRRLGRVLVVCALISGIYGLVSTVVLPVFGGLASESAGWFFGPLFIFAILRAFWCARNKKISLHREWMIRAFALGLGVGTQRIILIILISSTGYSFEQSFGPALWLGFGLNLLIAESWINATRNTK